MNYSTIHTIIVSGTTYMIAGTALSLFGLYRLGLLGMIKDFFTSKTVNNG